LAVVPSWSHRTIISKAESGWTVAMTRPSVTLATLVAWHIRSVLKCIAGTLLIIVKVASTGTLVYEDLALFERCPQRRRMQAVHFESDNLMELVED